MHKTFLTFLGLAGMMLLVCSGCTRPTILGANTGVAYGMAKQNQIFNPDAEGNLDPVVGMEGNVAETAMERYRAGFEKQDQGQGFMKSAVSSGIQTR